MAGAASVQDEAAQLAVTIAKTELKLNALLAITSLDNESSIKLLKKLGFDFIKEKKLSEDNTVKMFGLDLQ